MEDASSKELDEMRTRRKFPFLLIPDIGALHVSANIPGIPKKLRIGSQEWHYVTDMLRTYGCAEQLGTFMDATLKAIESTKLPLSRDVLEFTLTRLPSKATEFRRWTTANERLHKMLIEQFPDAFKLSNPIAFELGRPAVCGSADQPITVDAKPFDISLAMPHPERQALGPAGGHVTYRCTPAPTRHLLPNTPDGMAASAKYGTLECLVVPIDTYQTMLHAAHNSTAVTQTGELQQIGLSANCDGREWNGYYADVALTMDITALWHSYKDRTLKDTVLRWELDAETTEALFYVLLNTDIPNSNPYAQYLWWAVDPSGHIRTRMVSSAPAHLFQGILVKRYKTHIKDGLTLRCMEAFVEGICADLLASEMPFDNSDENSKNIKDCLSAWYREGLVGTYTCHDVATEPGPEYDAIRMLARAKKLRAFTNMSFDDLDEREKKKALKELAA